MALLEAIYHAAGISVGCYTSPHLIHYCERVRINRETVSENVLTAAFARVESARQDTPLTFFEFGTLAAMDIFRHQKIQLAILEVGLGGRLDAVNIFNSDVAVISSIAIDHSEWLGPDREAIGYEKAGIFRSGCLAVCGDPEPPASVTDTALKIGTSLFCYGCDFSFHCSGHRCRFDCPDFSLTDLPPPALAGPHQQQNAATALMVVAGLRGQIEVDTQAIMAGLRSAHLPGRFHIISGSPSIVLDVAHNPAAVQALAFTLKQYPVTGHTVAVVGMMKDKAIKQSLGSIEDLIHAWYLSDLPPPRGGRSAELGEAVSLLNPMASIKEFTRIELAFSRALEDVGKNDRIIAFGSFVGVGAIMHQLS